MYNWTTLLYTWNKHNILNQPKSKKIKKKNKEIIHIQKSWLLQGIIIVEGFWGKNLLYPRFTICQVWLNVLNELSSLY